MTVFSVCVDVFEVCLLSQPASAFGLKPPFPHALESPASGSTIRRLIFVDTSAALQNNAVTTSFEEKVDEGTHSIKLQS